MGFSSKESKSASEWQQRYELEKTGWDRGSVHPALLDWLTNQELTPGEIIVPGCGRGHEVVYLAQRQFAVTAIDFAEAPIAHLLKELNRINLEAHVVQADLFDWAPQRPVDAVYEQTCLCAIDPDLRSQYESRLFNWLKPGGKLFTLFMQVDGESGPPFDCQIPAMKRLFGSERWAWPAADVDLKKYAHPSGQIYELAAVLTRRRDQVDKP